ncbi:hypothetical protein [Microvirga terricola]|uniref:DUF3551 domain-containing protein n=1 Tax=Microvirga terricola TaxID=2719797 RepID=A0ABX0VD24_9HYPH|nr:hypothetical protein [Microvirga terricola]NIX76261.1 hypothetical protein [Microvirga terricola]
MRYVVVLSAMLAGAPGAGAEPGSFQLAQAPNQPNCHCRANGQLFELGQKTCLKTARGPRIAQCSIAINVTNWEFTETPCPES